MKKTLKQTKRAAYAREYYKRKQAAKLGGKRPYTHDHLEMVALTLVEHATMPACGATHVTVLKNHFDALVEILLK